MNIKTYYQLKEFKANFTKDYQEFKETFWDCSEKQFLVENIKHYNLCLKNVSYLISEQGQAIIETVFTGVNYMPEIINRFTSDEDGTWEEERLRLKYTFENIIDYLSQSKEEKPQRQNLEKSDYYSNSFKLFDRVRYDDVNDYDMTMLLKEYSQNYDIELLNCLAKDISFYLFVEKEEMENNYVNEDIENAIIERKKSGLEIPYTKIREPKKISDDQQKKIDKLAIKFKPVINLEHLLFPYEFYNVRRFEFKIKTKINELRNQITKEEQSQPLLDFSNAKATEKIIMLQQLGILDFLKEKQPFTQSTNALATAISGFIGEKPETVQSYINPINNPTTSQKNNPMTKEATVLKVNQKLISIGYNPPK